MFEAAELDLKLSKQAYAEKLPRVREALLEAQARLYESRDFSVAIVIAGAEGAGKGETVNTLLQWMDARGIDSHALGAPSEEEAGRPPFYRFWRRLPPRGRIAIFFGSWYTLPILDRSLGRSDDARLDADLSRIVEFERMLADEGVVLLKFWLHITKQQQKRRLRKLEADPDTAWRVTPQDWEFAKTYDPFVAASARALRRTSTGHAPWEIVPANNRRYREMAVAEHVLAALEKRIDAPPPPPPEPEPLPEPARINVLNSLDLTRRLEPDDYDRKLREARGRLGSVARRMAGADTAAVLVFEGMDAAGKGGCIRRAVSALDSRFYRIVQVAAPSDEEKERPYLWRFWRHVPGRGHCAIFDRSWYGRVLVERIEGFCAPSDWKRAYAEINAFEEQLAAAGTLVFKFWLAISPEEQLRRFQEREATGFKRYKITDEDWRNREKWPAYEAAACDMIERTSTEIAPWHVVEAEDKNWARVRVLETLCEGLERACAGSREPARGGKRKRRKRGKKRD